jgi:cardiolipin synthase A/B
MLATRSFALQWLPTGREIFPAMLAAIAAAQKAVQFEVYIYADDKLGRQFRDALVAAAGRGVQVQVLVDAVGSWMLPGNFFQPLFQAGGHARRFNPLHYSRFGVRDHRKLLICDGYTVFIGGFNLSDVYDGAGVSKGWCDLGVKMEDSDLAMELGLSFNVLFNLADFRQKPLIRLRLFKRKRSVRALGNLLFTHPGRGASPFQAALHRDLEMAHEVRIISAYFLPTRRLRRDLMRVVRRGGRVQLMLAGKTDVQMSQFAARSLYHRLLKAGVEIYEYQPQVLHAKMILCDHTTYIGSSNLDIRSLNLNYELMLRLQDKTVAQEAKKIFDARLEHCKKIERHSWKGIRSFWQRWRFHWAHFLLSRIDPFVALWQFRRF